MNIVIRELLLKQNVVHSLISKGKGPQWPVLISILLSRQPTWYSTGSHKPSRRWPLLSAMPVVTFPTSELPVHTAWWTEAHLCEELT